MTRPQQKLRERHIVEEYMNARAWKGTLQNGDEPPDFWINLADGRTIAAEVLEYHQPWTTAEGYTPRQVEEAWDEIRHYVVEYRESQPSLKGLSVRLEFLKLKVPSRSEITQFVTAIHNAIDLASDRLGKHDTEIRPRTDSSPILRAYLKAIRVRRVSAYLEWDWNHSVGGVGTNDTELLGIVASKLVTHTLLSKADQSHLVVAGNGPGISQVMAPWSEEQLNSFSSFNSALAQGPFDEVAILSMDYFLWRRVTSKWQRL